MKHFLTILFWLTVTTYLVMVLGFSSESRKGIICNEICIIIEDSLSRRFYSGHDIEQIIKSGGINTLGYPISAINTRKLEELFYEKPYIQKVDIYTTMNGLLAVRVKQREPVVRVICRDGKSWYLDKDGYIMPESRKFTQYVLVASGNFTGGDQIKKYRKLDDIENVERIKDWVDILSLANYLRQDELWVAQVVHIYLDRQGIFELYPRVGAHQIILGDVKDLAERMEKLKKLYETGLEYEGWNNYDKIDLRFKNQVVCTKR